MLGLASSCGIMCRQIARVGALAFNPIITSTTPSYSIPHYPFINTVIVLTAAQSSKCWGAITGKMTLPVCAAACLPSKIRSLLEVRLGLLMSTCVGKPVSWTMWQIIFTAGRHCRSRPLHPFLLLSFPFLHPSL